MQLYEKYRPKVFDEVVGQESAIKQIKNITKTGTGGRAFWISGNSGTGKTTLARIIARQIADEWYVQEFDSADNVSVEAVDDIDRTMNLYGAGTKTGRAFIINEAHGLRSPVIRRLLGILERIPNHVVFIFTTTKVGQLDFFDGQIDASPLLSRCQPITLTNQGLTQKFAELVKSIAVKENIDSQPIEKYIRLAKDLRNNCRAMLQAVESDNI